MLSRKQTYIYPIAERGDMPTNYWLYYGSKVLTAVRGDGLSESKVREIAIDQHDRVPLNPSECTPFEWRLRLVHATVKVFPEGN